MQVHAFDPTPRSIAWLKSQSLPHEFVFHDYGVAAFDGKATFHAPENSRYVSYSAVSSRRSTSFVEAPVWRLETIRRMLGHEHIDVLKMDIEGGEYEVLQDLIVSKPPVKQLLVEFHHRWKDIGLQKTRVTVRNLNQEGFRIFNLSPTGEEYSFIKD